MALAFAGWYLGAATGAMPIVLDGIFPATGVRAAGAFLCESHECGCESAEACARGCCCFSSGAAPAPRGSADGAAQGETAALSALAVMQCRGGGDGAGVLTAFHASDQEPARRPAGMELPETRGGMAPCFPRTASPDLDPPEKVPLFTS